MSEEAKLLPCPFCGANASSDELRDVVVCGGCDAYMDFREWNTRSLEAAKALLEQHGYICHMKG